MRCKKGRRLMPVPLLLAVVLSLSCLALFGILAGAGAASAADTVDLKVLLICSDGTDPSCETGIDALDRLGVPYTVIFAVTQDLTPEMLSDGAGHAYYSGVMLSIGNLAYYDEGTSSWLSAFTDAEWQALHDFESRFSIREASLYTFPSWEYGLTYVTSVDTTATPLPTSLTGPGKEVFDYLNPNATITISNAWGYEARPTLLAVPNGSETIPLLTTPEGYTIAALYHHADGRESLVLCAANNSHLVHTKALIYGVVDWVTKKLMIGERHVFLSPQLDDYFFGDDHWDPATNTTVTANYRMLADDLNFVVGWQQANATAHPNAADVVMDMVFNGEGLAQYGSSDPLNALTPQVQGNFKWTNHTYTHDTLNHTNYAFNLAEIEMNNQTAIDLGLTRYRTTGVVTGEISGLYNSEFIAAAKDAGVKYLASNTSVPDQNNPTFNTGIPNAIDPSVLQVPRHPANIFYNADTPVEEVSEYNWLYRSYWGRDLTYGEILDQESNHLLDYMMDYDIDPLMFHQINLMTFDEGDGTRGTLLTNLLDVTLDKYDALFNLPVRSPDFDGVGQAMTNRAAFNAAAVSGSVSGGTVSLSGNSDCTVPVTGLDTPGAEFYGNEYISHLQLTGGSSLQVDSTEPPRIQQVKPVPGSLIDNGKPFIGVDYSDPAWGIDSAATRIEVDGQEMTGSSLVSGLFATYVPTQTMPDGLHSVTVTVVSHSGLTVEKSWQFETKAPKLTLSLDRIYWASYDYYLAQTLSVDYRINNVGTGKGLNAEVQGGTATNGVIMITPPIDLGDLDPSQSAPFTLQYLLPGGITNFKSMTYAICFDDGGNVYGMPAP